MNDMMEREMQNSLSGGLLSRVFARCPNPLAVVPEEPRCGAPYDDGNGGKDRIALAIPKCVVHRRREEREAKACARTQECDRGERRGGMQGEGVDDVSLDTLEVEDCARSYECNSLQRGKLGQCRKTDVVDLLLTISGPIQCVWFWAVQPVINRPIGSRIVPGNMDGSLYSGLPTPPFLFVKYL